MNLSPQHANYCADSTPDRIKKSPRWGDEGVAATVGTIMALLVFLTFMGLFTNQFVPVWMSDNESSHMSTAIQQMVTLKSQVDISISNNANSRVAPTPASVVVTLSSPGIPVFAGPTAGILKFVPEAIGVMPTFNVTYTYISSTGGVNVTYVLNSSNDGGAGGYLDLYCPNRYYVEQHLTYEAGAIILNQTEGEFVIAGPQFLVRDVGTQGSPNKVMLLTQVSLMGTNKTVGGTGSKMVNANLQFADTKTYENGQSSNVTIEIVSSHGIAWERYFNRTLTVLSGLEYGTDFVISKVPHLFEDERLNYYELTITIFDIKVLDHTHAEVDLAIGDLGV